MKIFAFKHNSIAFRLAVIFIVAVFVQCAVMFFLLVKGGAIRKIQENSYTYFSSQVASRKENLESQMENVWTNFGDYPEQISQLFDLYREQELPEEEKNQAALRAAAPYLLNILNTTKTTGVFLILDSVTEDENQHPAVYIRNTDVDKAGSDNFTLTLRAGPMEIVQDNEFTTNENWSWNLQLNEENNDFFEKAYQNAGLNEDEKLLSYWSPPFTLTGDSDKVLAYSMPLSDSRGEPIGVFGVEISVNQLYKFLPKNDLSAVSSLGYVLGLRVEENGPIFPMAVRGAVQERLLNFEQPLSFTEVNSDLGIYEIENVNSTGKIYGSIKKMGMYYNNTPFSNEQWYLIGLAESTELLKFADNVFSIMIFSLVVTIIFGIIVAIVSSRLFSKPVTRLANEVRNLSQNESPREKLTRTGLAEIDELSESIMITQKKMSELNIKLKYERDRDPLTGMKNRHAFDREKGYYFENRDKYKMIGMGIFDLNGLKYVNDNFGHKEGDNYLCEIASSICWVFKECPVFRIGGDEFAIIIADISGKELEHSYSELCGLLERSKRKKPYEGAVAFGFSYFAPDKDCSLEQAQIRADKHMYDRKKLMKELGSQ